MIDIYDAIGILGAFLYLLSYGLLQRKRGFADDVRYWYMNIVAAICVLFSLYFYWNLAAVIGNICWLAISIFGLLRTLRAKKVGVPVSSLEITEIPAAVGTTLSEELQSRKR